MSGAPDAGLQISNAIAALPAAGGIVDATCYVGPVQINSNMMANAPTNRPITILLGPTTYILGASAQQVLAANDLSIIGSGVNGTIVQFQNTGQDIFVIPNSNTTGQRLSIQNMTIKPAQGVTKSGGNIFSIGGQNGLFRNLELFDPYQGFFIQNALLNRFENITMFTTKTGTLNYGFFLYGTDIDNFFTSIYGTSSYSITDAFIHIRNRVSGTRFTDISWQDDAGATGLLLDCGTSPTVTTTCTNSYGALPTDRPELLHFEKLFIESGISNPAIAINGGQDIRFSNSYLATSLNGIRITGESTAISIENTHIVNIYEQCVLDQAKSAYGKGYATFSLVNSELNVCSQESNLSWPAVELGTGTSNVRISGNHIGHNTFVNFTYDSSVGVQIDGGGDYNVITGNDFDSENGTGGQYMVTPIALPVSGPGIHDIYALNTAGVAVVTH